MTREEAYGLARNIIEDTPNLRLSEGKVMFTIALYVMSEIYKRHYKIVPEEDSCQSQKSEPEKS